MLLNRIGLGEECLKLVEIWEDLETSVFEPSKADTALLRQQRRAHAYAHYIV